MDVHVYHHNFRDETHQDVVLAMASLIETVHSLERKVERIMATMQEVIAELRGLKAQVAKSKVEILKKLEEVENQAPDNTTPEFDAALAELKTEIQGVDDLNADTPTA
jgi:uncharacterized protein (UPF0335 family)